MAERIFTVEEANALLGRLEGVVRELGRRHEALSAALDRIQVLGVLWGEDVHRPENPDREEFLRERTAARREVEEMDRLIAEEILALGVRFPAGGLEHGLLDFPTTLDGRVVFLCWQLGEPELGWWHEVDGGFAGRRPLSPEIARRMGREPDLPSA